MIDLLTEMEHLKRKKKKRKKRMTASVLKQGPNKKGSKERLFIMTRTHNMQIFGEIPLSSHKTTLKQQVNG